MLTRLKLRGTFFSHLRWERNSIFYVKPFMVLLITFASHKMYFDSLLGTFYDPQVRDIHYH